MSCHTENLRTLHLFPFGALYQIHIVAKDLKDLKGSPYMYPRFLFPPFQAADGRSSEPRHGSLDRSICTGGPDVIRKEAAWPFYTFSFFGVRLCWEFEKPKGS